jgi:hypothetical protein
MTTSVNDMPGWQRARLAELLEAFEGIQVSDAERRILGWLAGWETETVRTIVELVNRARHAEGGAR